MSNRNQLPEPKKSKGLVIGLIIGGILLVAAIVIVIILVLRARSKKAATSTSSSTTNNSSTTPSSTITCTSNANCSGSKPVCDTATSKCVACLQTSDCTAPKVCNTATKTCISAQCDIASDCTSEKPVCDGGVCKECINSGQCAGNPVQAANGEVICKTSNNTCVMCLTDVDCGGTPNTCSNGVCCLATPPTINSASIENSGTNSRIVINYSYARSLGGLKYVVEISCDNFVNPDDILYTSPITTTGTSATSSQIIVSEQDMQAILFPVVTYGIRIKLITACGATDFCPYTYRSPPSTEQPIQAISAAAAYCTLTTSTIRVEFNWTCDIVFAAAAPSAVMSRTNGFHPNKAEIIVGSAGALGNCSTSSTPQQCGYIYKEYQWTPLVTQPGETWYVRQFFGKNYRGAADPRTYTNLTDQRSFIVS